MFCIVLLKKNNIIFEHYIHIKVKLKETSMPRTFVTHDYVNPDVKHVPF